MGGRYRPCPCPLRPHVAAAAGSLPEADVPPRREPELTATQ